MVIKVTEENHILTVLLCRPEVKNAFNPEMIEALTQAFQYADKNSTIRAVILKGHGDVFCAGADLNWMKQMADYSLSENKKDSENLFEMFEAINECKVPIIGVVKGAAFGGALGLMACCDYVICDYKTQFCFSEVKMGLAPAVISAFILSKISPVVISHWLLTGKVFHSQEALQMGLVHEIVEGEELETKLNETVRHFKTLGPQAVRETKKLIKQLSPVDWSKAKDLCAKVIAERRVSEEGQEGLKSFFAKTKPSWSLSEI